jgi:hypothetical protein
VSAPDRERLARRDDNAVEPLIAGSVRLASVRETTRARCSRKDTFTGECRKAVLFVAVLGASNLTYAEPVLDQDLPTWVDCHFPAFEYFEGSAEIWGPTTPRVGVTRAGKYEPILDGTYEELSAHFGAAVIPARPYRPRDKAKASRGGADRLPMDPRGAAEPHLRISSLGERVTPEITPRVTPETPEKETPPTSLEDVGGKMEREKGFEVCLTVNAN